MKDANMWNIERMSSIKNRDTVVNNLGKMKERDFSITCENMDYDPERKVNSKEEEGRLTIFLK